MPLYGTVECPNLAGVNFQQLLYQPKIVWGFIWSVRTTLFKSSQAVSENLAVLADEILPFFSIWRPASQVESQFEWIKNYRATKRISTDLPFGSKEEPVSGRSFHSFPSMDRENPLDLSSSKKGDWIRMQILRGRKAWAGPLTKTDIHIHIQTDKRVDRQAYRQNYRCRGEWTSATSFLPYFRNKGNEGWKRQSCRRWRLPNPSSRPNGLPATHQPISMIRWSLQRSGKAEWSTKPRNCLSHQAISQCGGMGFSSLLPPSSARLSPLASFPPRTSSTTHSPRIGSTIYSFGRKLKQCLSNL